MQLATPHVSVNPSHFPPDGIEFMQI